MSLIALSCDIISNQNQTGFHKKIYDAYNFFLALEIFGAFEIKAH